MVVLLLVLLGLIGTAFSAALWREASRRAQRRPSVEAVGLGAVTNFFDTLGIGSFAPTTAWLKFRRLVPDGHLPATLNVGHALPTVAQALIFISLAELTDLAFKVFIYGIVIQALLSWINPGTYNPAVNLLHTLTEPVLRPVRRLLPPISGMDLSPLLAILALEVVRRLVVPLLGALAA